MYNRPFKQILVHYLLGICTRHEGEMVDMWLETDPKAGSKLKVVSSKIHGDKFKLLPNKQETKCRVISQLPADPASEKASEPTAQKLYFLKRRKRRLRQISISLAATFLIASMISLFLLVQQGDPAADSGFASEPFQSIEFRESTISYGQTATLKFGDGSTIILNGGSTLRYPRSFASDKREVYLEGEAYFSVVRDSERPFLVHAGNTVTHVLGTSFNIRAYKGEDKLQVAVTDGKVEVSLRKQPADYVAVESIYLDKNQWVTFRGEDNFYDEVVELGEGNIREMTLWKDRVLVFRNRTFEQVAELLERWYGVTVMIHDEDLNRVILEGEHQNAALVDVLGSLQVTMDFDFTIEEDRVDIFARE